MTSAKSTKPVTFIAKCVNQRLTLNHDPQTNAERGPGGALLVAANPGTHAQFEDHTFTTDDPKEIEGVRNSSLFNISVWEEGAAPDMPRPTVEEQLAAIRKAERELDADAIGALKAAEAELHDRKIVKDAADEALKFLADEADGEEKDESPPPSQASDPT